MANLKIPGAVGSGGGSSITCLMAVIESPIEGFFSGADQTAAATQRQDPSRSIPRTCEKIPAKIGSVPNRSAIAVVLAFFFGYLLTSLPLLRSGMALSAVIPIALASDTVSITIMEVIDNVTVILVPGAMDAGVDDPLLYGSVALGFAIAYPFAFLANRYMIARGKGHAVVHEYHGSAHTHPA